jgi:hypothetical protein
MLVSPLRIQQHACITACNGWLDDRILNHSRPHNPGRAQLLLLRSKRVALHITVAAFR